ncbi:uncharacterized protein MELLADRAFT_87345 [Melampsora larici-populina 98AG31]|uniref:Uncharacterized protein n=1 Tax=Melampsora larici-populina (strain 98AG31 / pathotype 3-4-7) TaxID=747676 RepID=F4RMX6_MELLP|nr:uncharacterized protein MELLADRAFT_87345 [Melampsora larici-populina 98AG31]EGG06192.1 hypothetical protein MELLADRAFT_87345 [Melampsora larici-populina 98AG31]
MVLLGQSYVALSRGISLEGLQMLRFEPHKVMAHPEFIKWSKSLLAIHWDHLLFYILFV